MTDVLAVPDPQVFRDAAGVIRTNGWFQGNFWDASVNLWRRVEGKPELPPAKCPVCLLGAINVVTAGDPVDGENRGLVARKWVRQFTDDFPAFWNDAPDRNVHDVLALLYRAAAAAESARAASQTGEVGRG